MSILVRHLKEPDRVYLCHEKVPTIDSVLYPISPGIDVSELVTDALPDNLGEIRIASFVQGFDDPKLSSKKKEARFHHQLRSGDLQWLVIESLPDDDPIPPKGTKTKWIPFPTFFMTSDGMQASRFISAYLPPDKMAETFRSNAKKKQSLSQLELKDYFGPNPIRPPLPTKIIPPPGTIVISTTATTTTPRPPEIVDEERKKSQEILTSQSSPRERTLMIAKFLTTWLDRNYSTLHTPCSSSSSSSRPKNANNTKRGQVRKRTSTAKVAEPPITPDYSLTGVLASTGEQTFESLFRRVEQEAENDWRLEEAQRNASAESGWTETDGQLHVAEGESAVLKDIGNWFNAHCSDELAHYGIGPRMLWQVYFDHAPMSERRQNVIVDLALENLLDPRDFMTLRLNAVSKAGRENGRWLDRRQLSKYESPEDHDGSLYSRVGYLNARLKNHLHEFCDRFTRTHWLKRFCRAVLRDITSCMKHHDRLSRELSSSAERFVHLNSPIEYEQWLRKQPAVASALASIEQMRTDNVIDFVPLHTMPPNHRQWSWPDISRHFRTVLHVKEAQRDENVQVILLRFVHHPALTGGGMWLARLHHRSSEHRPPIGVWLTDTYLSTPHWRTEISSWYAEQLSHLDPIVNEFLRRAETVMAQVRYGFVPPLLPHGAPIQRHPDCPSSFRTPMIIDPIDPLSSWFGDLECNWGHTGTELVRFSTWRYLIDQHGHWDADDLTSMTDRLAQYARRAIHRHSPYWNHVDRNSTPNDDEDDDDLQVPNDALGYDSDEDHDPLVPVSTVQDLGIDELGEWWVNNVNWDLDLLRQFYDDEIDAGRFDEWTTGGKDCVIVKHMVDEFERMSAEDTDCADDEDEDEDEDGDDDASTQARVHFPLDRDATVDAMVEFANDCVRLRSRLFAMHRVDAPSSFVFGRLLRTNRRLIDPATTTTTTTDDEARWSEIWTTPFAVLIDFVLPSSWCSLALYRRAPTFVKRWALRLLLWRYFPPLRTVSDNDRRWNVWLAGRVEARRLEYQAMLQRSVRRSYVRWLICWKNRLDALLDRVFNSSEEPDLCLSEFRRLASAEELATADETSRLLRLTYLSSQSDAVYGRHLSSDETDLYFHSFAPIGMDSWSTEETKENDDDDDAVMAMIE